MMEFMVEKICRNSSKIINNQADVGLGDRITVAMDAYAQIQRHRLVWRNGRRRFYNILKAGENDGLKSITVPALGTSNIGKLTAEQPARDRTCARSAGAGRRAFMQRKKPAGRQQGITQWSACIAC
jgi:hypothetical protein